jgi:hypothetical protein
LKALENNGPRVTVDLAIDIWESIHGPDNTTPYSFYESTRRAAVGLVAKGRVLSGKPESPRDGRLRAKAIFWLPGQTAPELRRQIPKSVFETGVLKALAEGPRSYADVAYYVGSHLTKDQWEYNRLRGSISLAITRLVAAGRIHRYMGSNDLGEREMLSVVM